MIGTLVNVAAVLAGSAVGVLVGARLPERFTRIVFTGIGLFTLVIGFSMALKTQQFLIMVFSVVLGAIAGELLDIDRQLNRFGEWLMKAISRNTAQAQAQAEQRTSGQVAKRSSEDEEGERSSDPAVERSSAPAGRLGTQSQIPRGFGLCPASSCPAAQSRFSEGMVTAFLLFCMGSMTVLGALEEGMGKTPNLLLAKSVLDGFASVALAAGFGVGVAFSVVPLLVYQGGLTLVAMLVGRSLPAPVVTEVSAAGGVLLVGLGLNLLGGPWDTIPISGTKSGYVPRPKLKVLNLLPALVFAGVLAAVFLSGH